MERLQKTLAVGSDTDNLKHWDVFSRNESLLGGIICLDKR